MEYFEDKAKASLRAKIDPDTEIGQKGAFCKGLDTYKQGLESLFSLVNIINFSHYEEGHSCFQHH